MQKTLSALLLLAFATAAIAAEGYILRPDQHALDCGRRLTEAHFQRGWVRGIPAGIRALIPPATWARMRSGRSYRVRPRHWKIVANKPAPMSPAEQTLASAAWADPARARNYRRNPDWTWRETTAQDKADYDAAQLVAEIARHHAKPGTVTPPRGLKGLETTLWAVLRRYGLATGTELVRGDQWQFDPGQPESGTDIVLQMEAASPTNTTIMALRGKMMDVLTQLNLMGVDWHDAADHPRLPAQ